MRMDHSDLYVSRCQEVFDSCLGPGLDVVCLGRSPVRVDACSVMIRYGKWKLFETEPFQVRVRAVGERAEYKIIHCDATLDT